MAQPLHEPPESETPIDNRMDPRLRAVEWVAVGAIAFSVLAFVLELPLSALIVPWMFWAGLLTLIGTGIADVVQCRTRHRQG